ncbi:MAG: hypothetical protein Q8L96_07940 [Hylemonella sp.]|nr:hypothetical protein [Hylemonella sp.]
MDTTSAVCQLNANIEQAHRCGKDKQTMSIQPVISHFAIYIELGRCDHWGIAAQPFELPLFDQGDIKMATLDASNDEIELYRAMSKLAGTLFLEFNKQLVVGVQKLTDGVGGKGEVPSGVLSTLLDRSNITQSEEKALQKYSKEEVYQVWKKHIESIDYSISFRPRVEKPVESINVLALPGEKVTVNEVSSTGDINIRASWEVEIDLGIIRGKVSW